MRRLVDDDVPNAAAATRRRAVSPTATCVHEIAGADLAAQLDQIPATLDRIERPFPAPSVPTETGTSRSTCCSRRT